MLANLVEKASFNYKRTNRLSGEPHRSVISQFPFDIPGRHPEAVEGQE
jgi:hypothetical protein